MLFLAAFFRAIIPGSDLGKSSSSKGMVTSTRGMQSVLTGRFKAVADVGDIISGSAGVETQRAITANGLPELETFKLSESWCDPGSTLLIFRRKEHLFLICLRTSLLTTSEARSGTLLERSL